MAARTSSLVPPKYKTKSSVKNWSEYEQGLRNRGDVTIWFGEDAISGWVPRGSRSRGAQRRYSDLAIETALTLGLLFHLPLRQTEGFVGLTATIDGSRPQTSRPQHPIAPRGAT